MTPTEAAALERLARGLALEAHGEQQDLRGRPYGLHLAAVAGLVQPGIQRAAAWLHDVLEDTALTSDDLRRNGVPDQVVALVEAVTRNDGDSYTEHIQRVSAAGTDAVAIKRADLEDHAAAPPNLARRYAKAWKALAQETDPRSRTALQTAREHTRERRGRHEYARAEPAPDRVTIEANATAVIHRLLNGHCPEEAAWSLTRIASAVLDHDTTHGDRQSLPEGTYVQETRTKGHPPKAGAVYAELTKLDLVVRIDDAWRLDAPPTEPVSFETWGLKLRLEASSTRAIAAPRNYAWGFYGTWEASDNGRTWNVTTEDAWLAVLATYGTGGRGTSEDRALREVLDSPSGRRYADRVAEALQRNRGHVGSAVRDAGRPTDRDAVR